MKLEGIVSKRTDFRYRSARAKTRIKVKKPPSRLLTRHEAAMYCRLSPQTFSAWVKLGRLPASIRGTARWDRKAIDAALDSISGLMTQSTESAFDQWKAKHARTP
jgi:predicted DNA-binding transcriptional regulator AlpA